jgi:hypothetical protein
MGGCMSKVTGRSLIAALAVVIGVGFTAPAQAGFFGKGLLLGALEHALAAEAVLSTRPKLEGISS